MTTVTNTVVLDGPPGPVFDLVTMAQFWPRWHPATAAVGGVTQRPYHLGDVIRERGRIGEAAFNIAWRVAEYVRPVRVLLECQTPPARIAYEFRQRGQGTELQRELSYEPAVFAGVFPDPAQLATFMHRQSQEALDRLRDLIGSILEQETVAL